ncbi:MAG: putative DNA-binding domain-containing protein [Planctomycetes bacterium]|nr:putative DNA-binding domain-containing protein [Planctomycetota bacterium]
MRPDALDPDLGTLQRWLSCLLQDPEPAEHAIAHPAPSHWIPAEPARDGRVVTPSATMQPMQRVDVYGGGYVARLVGALAADFPGLVHALGAEGFDDLGRAYVAAHPSHDPNLSFFSRHMVAFLATRDDLPHRDFLRDLARLEFAMLESFHAERSTALDPESLADLPPQRWASLVLRTSPSLRLVASDYPVDRFLQASFDDEDPEIPGPERSFTAVHRKDYRVWRSRLTERAFETLAALRSGATFGEAIELAGDEADQVGGWFRNWSADDVFVGAEP